MIKLMWQCIHSPRLYYIYRDGPRSNMYQPQGFEKWGDKIINTANTILNIGLYASPFICMYIYKRGFFAIDEVKSISRFFGCIGCIIALSLIMRAYGRATNSKYTQFLKALTSPDADKKAYLDGIRKYDFEFTSWPTSYTVSSTAISPWLGSGNPFTKCANETLPVYQRAPIQILAFFATHTFGLRLIYPGSLAIIQSMLWSPLFQGRTQLVESFDGKRAKIGTAEGNAIDTMFVDNRSHSPKGKILVVCCEGNSGFYEVGILATPAKAGYSALGWNHPGFAGSTGQPYPSQEHNAIDAVMQYAINELGFKPENIVLYGWSIGGYTATWAAVHYPIKALILDATFDDLLPLAQNHMPASWSLLVKEVVRSYVDLNVAELMKQYSGPVQLIRRTEDEIICLRPGNLSTNRGNHLLMQILDQRHSDAISNDNFPSAKGSLTKFISMTESQRATLNRTDIVDNERKILKLINKYMHDYRSSHCTPLPEDHFIDSLDSLESFKQD